MIDIFDNFEIEETAEEKATLEYLTTLGEEATALANEMDRLDDERNQLNVRFRHLTEKEMPRCLTELGMNNFTLKDGTTYQLKETISGNLDKAPDRAFAVDWCERHGLDELFTVDLGLTFPKGGHNEALELKGALEERGLAVNFKEGIHHATFSKHLREMHKENMERLENGEYVEPIPFAELGVYHGTKAEIKKKKK